MGHGPFGDRGIISGFGRRVTLLAQLSVRLLPPTTLSRLSLFMQDPNKPIALPTPIAIPSAPILAFPNSTNELQQQIHGEPPNKKRRKERACDYCRRRKIKCDGPLRQDQICTNCTHGHRHCTYLYVLPVPSQGT